MSRLLPTPYKKGQRFTTTVAGIDLKILAKAENYLMLKYVGKTPPFCIFVKNMPGFLFKIGAHIKN